MTDRADELNPLLLTTGLPRYDQVRPEHVVPAVRRILGELERRLETIEAGIVPTWDGLMVPLESLDIPLQYVWEPVEHLLNVRNSESLRSAYEEVLEEVVTFGLRMHQSRPIYDGLAAIRESTEWDTLSPAQQRAITLRIKDAESSGVALTGADRERFNEIASELSRIENDFQNHVLDATKAFELIVTDPADTDGWPTHLRDSAAQSYTIAKTPDVPASPEAGPWRITLDIPSYLPFMQHSRNRTQREQVYRAYITRASSGDLDNGPLIERIIVLRREEATLLGYETYAELSLSHKMAGTVHAVEDMFAELTWASKSYAHRDFEELSAFAVNAGETEPVTHWDVAFWAERLRETRFGFTDEQLRPYFPLPRVLAGLFSLSEHLFGIRITESDVTVPTWHDDVRYYNVYGGDGKKIASFYLDPYSRPSEKRGGAWMDVCFDRRIVGGEVRLPVIYLCCNGTPPVGDRPSLMSFDEVETLFHEFGHGLQGMLTTIDVADVSGINGIEWDAVELASQFMENWCYHKPTLIGMTRHVDTGEPLPDELFGKILKARTYRSGSFMVRQLEFGMTDMELHHKYYPDGCGNAFDAHYRIAQKMSVLPPLKENRFLCAFSHIFGGGYAAGYYSYLWANVLSADAFAAFEEAGLDNDDAVGALGRKYRETVLSLGGSRHPMDVFIAFRGRKPSTEALLRHLGLHNDGA